MVTPTWLHRAPTVDEVEAHAKAHPVGSGRWPWSRWLMQAAGGDPLRHPPRFIHLRAADDGIEATWDGDSTYENVTIVRCLPCDVDGVPVGLVVADGKPAGSRWGDPCGCYRCVDLARGGKRVHIDRFMILCPNCGNKRCPYASDHAFACTGSNEPWQDGSVYR